MQFIKKFLGFDSTVISLSGLRKREEYIKVSVPANYKKVYIPRADYQNYLLF